MTRSHNAHRHGINRNLRMKPLEKREVFSTVSIQGAVVTITDVGGVKVCTCLDGHFIC